MCVHNLDSWGSRAFGSPTSVGSLSSWLYHEDLAFPPVLATCLPGCIMRCVHPLSFQTQRQYTEATNESNRIFLYCAFLDFRYCLRGRVPGRGGGRGGDGGSGEKSEGDGQDVRARSHTRPDHDLLLFIYFFLLLIFSFSYSIWIFLCIFDTIFYLLLTPGVYFLLTFL